MPITREFLQTIDWGKTPLGPIDRWPVTLRGYVEMILALPTPAIIFWGPEQTQIYNDGYAVIMGPRHPKYFGGTYRESWPETYPIIIPWMRQVLDEGRYIEIARAPINVTRSGFTEEAHFTFTLSPLRDDQGRIAGVYQPVLELTETVLRERRAEILRALGQRQSPQAMVEQTFAANAHDIPFAGIFFRDDGKRSLSLVASSKMELPETGAKFFDPHREEFLRVLETGSPLEIASAPTVIGPWPEPVQKIFVAPIRRSPSDEALGVIAFGISPRLHFDASYREFFSAIAIEAGRNLAAQKADQAEKDSRALEEKMRADAERARGEWARKMALVFEHAPVGIAMLTGPEHVFEVSNPLYTALLPHRRLLNLPIRKALPELEGQGIYELLDRVYQTGEKYTGKSIRLMVDRGDGVHEERFFDFVYQPMPGESGKIESIIVVTFETTELSRARRDAEEANRAKDEFFAILGHELRNPLAPITTALQLMRLRGDASSLRERTIIERQLEQITRLVDDLLDVSRITRGMVTLKRSPIELSEVVATAVEMASPLLEQRNHHLEIDVAETGLVVDGDSIRLAQVISNLLTNAAKYTQTGGEVRILAKKKDDRVLLSISDNGLGISPEMLPRVFEPFAQEKQALDRAQSGLGLGLAIVANLVKLHGGTVTAKSAGRGKGSTFTIELPRVDDGEIVPPLTRVSQLRIGATENLRVLIVDDNEDAADLFSEALSELGYDIRIAHDGPEAIWIAAAFEPHVALLDIGLPVMDGYEVARRLRGTPGCERIHLIAVTGYGQPSDRQRGVEAGFHAHLVKPVPLQLVVELLANYRRSLRA